MQRKISILLPETIYFSKPLKNQNIISEKKEYNIYFKNIIKPFDEKWDIIVNCKYGQNLGHCWRLADFCSDEKEFGLEIVIYNEYGEKLASKTTLVKLADKKTKADNTKVMFIGDSMTRSQFYVDHVVNTLYNIKPVGTRTYNNLVFNEGRGGWAYRNYFEGWNNQFGVCHFLFPKGIEADKYWGNAECMEHIKNETETYQFFGFGYTPICEGQYFTENNMLFKYENGEKILIDEKPEFEFSFEKYMERYNIDTPDFVSVLMGANDLQIVPYEKSEEKINEYINNTKRFIKEIHKADKNIKVIINLPVLGAEQYCWGTQLGCFGSEKMYRFNIMNACERLIEELDNRQEENIFVCPMIMSVDPVYGFGSATVKVNQYSEAEYKKQNNWVHPNEAGYKQMGDCLAAVIENIR